MVGIYKITRIETGKAYIGQTNDIERRFIEHKSNKSHFDTAIDKAILKHGADAFTYEIIEECAVEQLDEREKYWIDFYNTFHGFGYNCNEGGGCSSGENNGRTKLTDKEVSYIRDCYNQHKRRRDVYKEFEDKITFGSFASIWDGSTWKHIKPEVYTKENLEYYKKHATDGELSDSAAFSSQEVYEMRCRYVNETAKQIYEDVKDRCNYSTLQALLWGRTYKNVPIYSKKKKQWIT